MWTRSLLKQNAKAALSGHYGWSLLVCLLLSIVGVGQYAPQTLTINRDITHQIETVRNGQIWAGDSSAIYDRLVDELLPGLTSSEVAALLGFTSLLLLLIVAAELCFLFFVQLPLVVGRCRYFMENRQSQAAVPMGTVLTVFRRPYLNVVKVRFLVWLKITLGSLLIIPGIYWSYCYYMVPYLLAENPYMTTSRAMELSRQMMYGEKWHTFVLELSFLGWLLLCALTLGIGLVFLEPYYQATFAELYAALRAKAFANGMTDQNELAGFVRHDGGEYFA